MSTTDPDDDLNDDALLQEIDLLADVVLAAGDAGRALTDSEVDRALGIRPRPAG